MATPRLASERFCGAAGGPLHVDIRTGARSGEVRPVAVICHGFKACKDWGMVPKVAERLALAGFTAVTFNFSGSGVGPSGEVVSEPERWSPQALTGDLADLETVISHMLRDGPSWVGLVGHSHGGGVAILQAARDARVKALVTWASVAGFQRHSTGTLDVLAAASRVTAPWLIVHGSADESVPAEEAARLAQASGSARTERLTVDGAGHTFGARHPWAGSTPELESVLAHTARFLGRTLD